MFYAIFDLPTTLPILSNPFFVLLYCLYQKKKDISNMCNAYFAVQYV